MTGQGGRRSGRLRRWLRLSGFAAWLGGALGGAYVKLVLVTTRWDVRGAEHFQAAVAGGEGVIGAAWHGRLCLAPYWAPRGRRIVGMISANRDGDVIAAVLARFGVAAVRGSSFDKVKRRDKGGARALAEAEAELAQGSVLVITPDGPRGPRMRAEPGVALLSIRTGAAICPIAFSTRWGHVLGSWDRFLVPLPFGRGVQIAGPLLTPPTDDGPEAQDQFRRQIEDAITAITHEADRACGRTPVGPA